VFHLIFLTIWSSFSYHHKRLFILTEPEFFFSGDDYSYHLNVWPCQHTWGNYLISITAKKQKQLNLYFMWKD